MKRFLFLLVVVFFPLQASFAQLIFLDAAIESLIVNDKVAQGIYWVQEALKWNTE